MKKLLVTLIAAALALGSAPVLADDFDTKPLSKMTTEEAKAARAAAKAKWDAMTPEEKAAMKKAMGKKRLEELTAMEAVAAEQGPVFGSPKPLMGDFWTKREMDMLRPSTSTPPTQEQKTPAERK
jgi:hypothetical protein